MKNFNMIIPLAIIFLLLSGCNSNEMPSAPEATANKVTAEAKEDATGEQEDKEKNKSNVEKTKEDLVPELKDYETIVLEDIKENHNITIEYPKFNYAPLDEVLLNKHKEFEGQQEQVEIYREDGLDDYYSYHSTFEKPIITENIVSIYFEGRFYSGGGFNFSNTLNFDLKNKRVITLDDVLKEHSISLEVMADLVSQKLINDEKFEEHRPDPVTEQYKNDVMKETAPEESNYSSFIQTDDSIIFYKQYYSLFPNSDGIIDVEITWDEVEDYKKNYSESYDTEPVQDFITYEFGDFVEPQRTLKYVDHAYDFSVDIPQSWKGRYIVRTKENYYEHLPIEPSKSIAFSMIEEGKYIGDLFSIKVLEGISEGEVKEYYKDWPGFEGFIGAGNKVVLVYTRPGMLPEQLYEEPYIEIGNQFSIMVEEDMPKILDTLQFQ